MLKKRILICGLCMAIMFTSALPAFAENAAENIQTDTTLTTKDGADNQKPDSTAEQTEEQPEETEKQPEETEKQPEETEKQPEETEKQPEETEKQPEETEKQPEETEKQPEETEKQPEETEKQPEETENTANQVPRTFNVRDSESDIQVNGAAVPLNDVGVKEFVFENGSAVTFVPVRQIAEMLNCTVAWRSSDQTVHIFKNGKSVMLTLNRSEIEICDFEIGSKFVYTSKPEIKYIYGDDKSITPLVESGRTLIPLRAIAESLNAEVNYNAENKLISINEAEDMAGYRITMADIQARNLIETYDYEPKTELKTGNVTVHVFGAFEGVAKEVLKDVTVTLAGKTLPINENGECAFNDIDAGAYTAMLNNIPAGYRVRESAVTSVEVVAGEDYSMEIGIELQTGDVTVHVFGNFESANNSLVKSVTVTLDGKTVELDENGNAEFTGIIAGTYPVTVNNIPAGYRLQTGDVSVEVKDGEAAPLNIGIVKDENAVAAQ